MTNLGDFLPNSQNVSASLNTSQKTLAPKLETWRPDMRTNIVIDGAIMKEAMMLSKIKIKKAVVEPGLKLSVQIKKQEQMKSLRSKLKWDGNLKKMRLNC